MVMYTIESFILMKDPRKSEAEGDPMEQKYVSCQLKKYYIKFQGLLTDSKMLTYFYFLEELDRTQRLHTILMISN